MSLMNDNLRDFIARLKKDGYPTAAVDSTPDRIDALEALVVNARYDEKMIFKAAMLATLKFAHLELTGLPYVGDMNWTPKDQATLDRLYTEFQEGRS